MSRATMIGGWTLLALALAAPVHGQEGPRPFRPPRPLAPDAAIAAAEAALVGMPPTDHVLAAAEAAIAAVPAERMPFGPALAAAEAALAAMPPIDQLLAGAARAVTAIPQIPPAAFAPLAPFAPAAPMAFAPVPPIVFARPFARPSYRTVAPEPWLQQDPADSLYRAARAQLNARDFTRAAELFASIRARFPRSGYVGDSYYFQAFALQRLGGREAQVRAAALLDEQRQRYPNAGTRGDAEQLMVRLQGALAERGDPGAARALEDAARAPCNDADQELRATALSALMGMDSDRALPILREILQDRDECSVQLRRQAVFLLQRASGDQAVDVLLDLAHRNPDPDPEVRQQAVFWLSRVRTPEAGAALESILQQATDPQVQEQAVYALSQQRTPRSLEVLKQYVERAGAPKNLRAQALYWLGRDRENGGPAYVRQVWATLDDSELKQQAVHAIAQSGTAEDRAWLIERAKDGNEADDVRNAALYWASRTGMTVADLRSLYADVEGREVRGQVIYALSRSDDPAAVEALMEIATSETDVELRQNAVHWLGRSKDPRAAEFLLRLIRGRR